VDNPRGEFFCSSCGLVVEEKVEDVGPEWSVFLGGEGDVRERVGRPTSITMHDMGLATVIGKSNVDASKKPLSPKISGTVERLRVWDRRSQLHETADKNLAVAFGELRRLAGKLAIPETVIEKAAYTYRKAFRSGLIRGRSIQGMMAGCVYAACRGFEAPRTLKDIALTSNMKETEVALYYRILIRELDIVVPVPDPARCVSRIASRAGISEKASRRALNILRRAKELEVSAGMDPMGLAASALYIASRLGGEGPRQDKIADAAGVTTVTVRNRSKALRSAIGIDTSLGRRGRRRSGLQQAQEKTNAMPVLSS
jgi:transcription initiation factor TFIIB